jgi:hypothetical protein
MKTDSSIFQQTISRLQAFESQGLRYRIVTPDGQEFASAAPLEELNKCNTRKRIKRSVTICDLVRDPIEAMEVGEVIQLTIPDEHTHEITQHAWRNAVASFCCQVFGNSGVVTANIFNGVEILRLK